MELVMAYGEWIRPAVMILALILAYHGAPLLVWSVLIAAFVATLGLPPEILYAVVGVLTLFNIRPIRAYVISLPIMKMMTAMKFIPEISETERVALRAGNVWVEGELFSGKPNFSRMMKEQYPELTAEEKAFINGPVEKACQMTNDWQVWHDKDLTKEVWDFIKKEKFLGMIIPKEYGGLGFSALCHSEVVHKLAPRSTPLCISVMVPNSLGPAELLNHYGTEEQKRHYLPRLARGEEVPCFGLTEPNAGSDAGAIQSYGEVFKKDGKLYLRLNWNKRYITLAAVSTVIGLAFRLRDPENLLGKGADVGITCALIPSNTPGVVLGRRHDPLGVPFFNCPTQGKDVVVPLESAIIGGAEGAGRGWQMLMESLAAGRGISLPAQATGGVKYVARVASAYATVRKQFGISIGRFEGVVEPLARISGYTYLMEALRKYTLGAIDGGIKPPVITAIAKYQTTEILRKVVNDGMDILGGAAISRGPKNLIAHGYFSLPIGITVEGANILTRTLIIFGQGAMRAHPYAYKEVDAVEKGDVMGFDRAFIAHIGHVIRNTVRFIVLNLTRGIVVLPYRAGVTARYYQKLAWASATFALFADVAMALLGGKLKFKEKITGRYADALSWMYIASSILRRFEAEGRRAEDIPFLKWSLELSFHNIHQAFIGIFQNFEVPLLGWFFKGPLYWWASLNNMGTPPNDALELKMAELIQVPGEQRDRFTTGLYIPTDFKKEQFALVEHAWKLTVETDGIFKKVRKAIRDKRLAKKKGGDLYKDALAAGVITQKEFDTIALAEEARNEAVQVDSFTLEEFKEFHVGSASQSRAG